MRGLAIFLMTIFHTLLNVWNYGEVMSADNIILKIFLGLVAIFIHWRNLFFLISAIAHIYVMNKSLKNDTSRKEILRKQLISGTILLLIAYIYSTFFHGWGIIDTWSRTGIWDWSELNMVYYFSAIHNIAFGIFFAAIIFFFISKDDGLKKVRRNMILFGVLALVIIFISPLIQNWVNTLAGCDLSHGENFREGGYRQPILRFILVAIGGRETPLFPMLGVTSIGCVIGLFLIQDNPKKEQLKYGFIGGGSLIIYGLFHFAIFDKFTLDITFHVHPVWFVFVSTGLQVLIITTLFKNVEFNEKLNTERWLKRSRFLRRWSILSLSIFIFQVLEFIPRKLFSLIFSPEIVNLEKRNQTNLAWSLLFALIVIIFFELIIRSWELVKFKSSWEWFITITRSKIRKMEVNKEDPLNIIEILYNVKPIQLVDVNLLKQTKDINHEVQAQ